MPTQESLWYVCHKVQTKTITYILNEKRSMTELEKIKKFK